MKKVDRREVDFDAKQSDVMKCDILSYQQKN